MSKQNNIHNHLLGYLFLSFCLSIISCKGTKNQKCFTAEDLLTKTISSINKKNTESYMSLIDFDTLLLIWEQAYRKDSSYQDIINLVKYDRKEIVKMYSMGYNIFISTLERMDSVDEWGFKLNEFSKISEEQEPNYLIEKYNLKLLDKNYSKWSLKIYLSKYNECYYITEPIESNYLTEGW